MVCITAVIQWMTRAQYDMTRSRGTARATNAVQDSTMQTHYIREVPVQNAMSFLSRPRPDPEVLRFEAHDYAWQLAVERKLRQ